MILSSNGAVNYRFGIAVTTFIICVWILFFPHPYSRAIIAGFLFMPILIMSTLVDQDRFVLQDIKRSDKNKVNLLGPLLFVNSTLIFRTPIDFQAENDWRILVLTILISLSIALIVWVVLKKANFHLVLLIAVLYSAPLILQLNDWGQSTEELVITGSIEKKYTSNRPMSQTIVIRFNNEERNVYVSREAYTLYKIGDQACAKERKGWLGIVIRVPISCL